MVGAVLFGSIPLFYVRYCSFLFEILEVFLFYCFYCLMGFIRDRCDIDCLIVLERMAEEYADELVVIVVELLM